MESSASIWMNGEFVPWQDARIHILSHVIHYGSAVFEGIRCYHTASGPAVFRLHEHVRRLYDSAKIYRMEPRWDQAAFTEAILETIRVNGFTECYIRPVIYRGHGTMGVNPFGCPVDASISAWKWGKYLGEEALEQGVDVMVSSWSRFASNTMPALAKASANYMNSQLIKMEAVLNGYVEGIALDTNGVVSEGSGENVFVVRDGILYTPALTHSVLPGITRDTIIQLARAQNIQVVEGSIPREMLYVADELFLTGTAAEVTPVRSVDKIKVGIGRPGPVTRSLQAAFMGILRGELPDTHGWLLPVK